MNFGIAFCPRCQQDIPSDRQTEMVVVCPHCGWADDRSNKQTMQKLTRRFISTAVLMSTLMVITFIHAVEWGGRSIDIVPIQVKEALEIADAKDYVTKAKICIEVRNTHCAEKAFKKRVQLDMENPDAHADYAMILKNNKKYADAANSFAKYFELGGLESSFATDYADTLSQLGRFEDAKKFYYFVLNSKPDTLQVTVTESFVDMLIKADRLKEAQTIILNTRKKGDNTVYFLEQKLKRIAGMLRRPTN